MKLSSLTPSRFLVINFPFTSGWRSVTSVWQKHNLWFLLKQVFCRDRQAWFKDIRKWRRSPFSGHLFQYPVTLTVRNMCHILNLNLSRFNFQPLVLGLLFFTRLSSPLLATIFCLWKFLNTVIKLQCNLPFWYPNHYLFKLFYLRHFLWPSNWFCSSLAHSVHFFSPPFREQVCWNCT